MQPITGRCGQVYPGEAYASPGREGHISNIVCANLKNPGNLLESGHLMSERHLVGQVTDFGLLLGDSVKYDYTQLSVERFNRLESITTIAWYRNLDDNTYLIIEWDVQRNGTSTEVSRDTFDNSTRAWSTYLSRAFGIMM